MAKTPESSEHTSIKKRISYIETSGFQPNSLAKFVDNPRKPMPIGIPFHLKDYIELVDCTGCIIREDKRGSIDKNLPFTLNRLALEPAQWLKITTQFESRFKLVIGPVERLKQAASKLGMKRSPNLANCKMMFG